MPRACGVVVDGLQNHQITDPGLTHPPAETKVHLPPHRLSSALVRFPPNTQRGRRVGDERVGARARRQPRKGVEFRRRFSAKTVVFERHHHGNGEKGWSWDKLGQGHLP